MAFIPNEGDAPLDGEQAELDSVDLTIILDGVRLRGVKSGCAVTASAIPAMTAEVAAGVISYDNGMDIAVAGGTVVFAAAGSHMRFDLVVADSAGAISVISGAGFWSTLYGSTFPTYTNKVVLAVVEVGLLTTTITSVSIIDKRVMINLPSSALFDHGSLLGLADDDHGQYHNNARALTWLGGRSTTDLPEGTNLYFTAERVDDEVALLIDDSASITWAYNDATGSLVATVVSTGAPTSAKYVTTLADAALSAEVVLQWLGNFYRDTYPASPDAMNDEFDDTSGNSGTVNGLNARWAWRNQGTATIDFNTQGWATINSPAATNQNFRIIEQAIPAAQNYTVEAKFSFSGFGQDAVSDARGGIMLIDGVNGDFYECGLEIIAVQARVEVTRWTNVTTYFGGAFVVGEGTHASAHGVNNIYIRIQYVLATTTFTMFISQDGIGWQKCYNSWVDAVAVTKIGIGIGESSNQGLAKIHCDYFRRIA